MATTTNYGWTTPDDTALVKDGAAAIRTLGTSVDTTTKALNPSTTLGDIEYRSSTANTNTRLGIGSSGQVLTVAAGVPSWASGFANPLTTTGDTIYSSSGSTPARLGIGSSGNVLTVTGGVPVWAAPASGGGMTLLSTTTLSGASVTVSSIAQTYQHLYISITGLTTSPAVTGFIIEPNSDVNSVNVLRLIPGGSATRSVLQMGVNTITSSADNVALALTIENYTSTTTAKTINYYGTQDAVEANILSGVYLNTSAAVTEVKFKVSNALNPFNSGTVKIYGVK
jgi:hypothetical protein